MLTIDNVSVLQTSHTAQASFVLHAIYPGIGTQKPENAKAVKKMRTSTPVKKVVSTVPWIGLYGTATSVFRVQLDPTMMLLQGFASYAHLDLVTMSFRNDAHVPSKHRIFTKILPVWTVNRHIFGTSKPNPVMHVR